MKNLKDIIGISTILYPKQPAPSNLQDLRNLTLPVWLAIVLGLGISTVAKSVQAENTEPLDIQHLMKPQSLGNKTALANQHAKKPPATQDLSTTKAKVSQEPHSSTDVATEETKPAVKGELTEGKNTAEQVKEANANVADQGLKTEPVIRPEDGTFPSFAQADINNDHYLTKEELKNFPYMLKVFDMVDAGKDGKLEQHEYQNLEMETKK